MVAIPTYLLASTAVSSFGPLYPRGTVIRSPEASHDDFATVVGPVIESNFPDPAIIHVDGVSYAFATNNRKPGPDMIHVQMAISYDNTTWTVMEEDAMPEIGAWENGARVWAPDVMRLVSVLGTVCDLPLTIAE